MLGAVGIGIGAWQIIKATSKPSRRFLLTTHHDFFANVSNSSMGQVFRPDKDSDWFAKEQQRIFSSHEDVADTTPTTGDVKKKIFRVHRPQKKLEQDAQLSPESSASSDGDGMISLKAQQTAPAVFPPQVARPHQPTLRAPAQQMDKMTFSHVGADPYADVGSMMGMVGNGPFFVAQPKILR